MLNTFTRVVSSSLIASLIVGAAGLSPAAAEQNEPLGAGVTERFEESVETYTAGHPESVLNLATSGLEYATDNDLAEEISDSGPVPGARGDFGLDAIGAEDSKIIDGVTVYTDVATDLDMIHQEFDDSERIVSVLGSEAAPTVQSYALNLPESAFMEMNEDGSVSIYVDVVTQVEAPGEAERVESAAAQIIGKGNLTFSDLEDLDSLSEEQIDALAAIPDPEIMEVSSIELIGEVQVPWAVDANGNELETHFEINGSTLTQEISTNEETVFLLWLTPVLLGGFKK